VVSKPKNDDDDNQADDGDDDKDDDEISESEIVPKFHYVSEVVRE
jgi:hypothetical protein